MFVCSPYAVSYTHLDVYKRQLSDESRKDDLITFEELGVDSIMVDEAHNFKNLAIFSKMNNVSGISSSRCV